MERISNKCIIKNIAGVIYEFAPYSKPRNIDKIIDHVINKIDDYKEKSKVKHKYEFTVLTFVNYDTFYNILKEWLFSCKEYEQLNISELEWKKGITEPSNGISFVTAASVIDEERDFIDLDACVRNIYNSIIEEIINDKTNCFLCKHAEEYGSMTPSNNKICKTCTNNVTNKSIKNNYETHPYALLPRNSEEYKKLVEEGKIVGM